MATFSWFVLIFFFVINCVASVVQGITTFGDAIVLHIVWGVTARWTLSLDSCQPSIATELPWWCAMHQTALGSEDLKLIALAMYTRTVLLNTMMVSLALRATHAEERKKVKVAQQQQQIQQQLEGETVESMMASPLRRAVSFGLLPVAEQNAEGEDGSPLAEDAVPCSPGSSSSPKTKSRRLQSTGKNNSNDSKGRSDRLWRQCRALLTASGMSGPLLVASIFPQYVGSIVGETILTTIDQAALRKWFGVFLLFFASMYVVLQLRRTLCPSKEGATASSRLSFLQHNAQTGKKEVSVGGLIGCGLASFCGGVAGALTGVGGPPWMIFILVQDVPSFVVRLLFPLSSLPATYSRFAMALRDGLISTDVIPYHGVALAGGVIGVLVGFACGKLVGPQAFNTVVLSLIVLAAMVVLTENPMIQIVSLVGALGLVIVVQQREARQLRQKEEHSSQDKTTEVAMTQQSTSIDGPEGVRSHDLQREDAARLEDELDEPLPV